MKHQRMILLLAACLVITACDSPDFSYSGSNGKVTLAGDQLTLHTEGAPDATIASSGDLNINSKAVPLSPPQRGLLMMYYQNTQDIREQSVNMGKVGASASVNAIEDSMAGKSQPNEKQRIRDEVLAQVHTYELKMCQDNVNLKTIQDQLVGQLPDFKPYGSIFGARNVDECMKATTTKVIGG